MKKIPVDLNLLLVALDSRDNNTWYLDQETGDVFALFDDPEEEEKIEDDPDRYLMIEPPAPDDDFQVMEGFVAGLPEGDPKRGLEQALRRPKPFRSFRDALGRWPAVREQWLAASDRRTEDLARVWLADVGIEAIPRPGGATGAAAERR